MYFPEVKISSTPSSSLCRVCCSSSSRFAAASALFQLLFAIVICLSLACLPDYVVEKEAVVSIA